MNMRLKNGGLKSKKWVRVFAIAMTLAFVSLGAVAAYADVEECEIAENIFKQTGMRLEAKVGTLSYKGPTVFTDEEISEEIFNQTGMRLKAKVGTLSYKGPTAKLNEDSSDTIEPFAVVPPTEEAPSYPFSTNWSGTNNYTYTQYYFREGDFDADAAGPFDAEFYFEDGTYGGTITAAYVNGSYQVRAYTDGMGYYYVVLVNNSSSAASNATYVAY